mmetsp:Transcript_74866/g.86910  ORF Transcript_74866/g.86910 Transcript_74866/m.86910 type:complete len:85 (-) Transcript_74866:440-694(-)
MVPATSNKERPIVNRTAAVSSTPLSEAQFFDEKRKGVETVHNDVRESRDIFQASRNSSDTCGREISMESAGHSNSTCLAGMTNP